ncbi:hypothetical protein ZIOFF_061280 [Zingiber officinale]|uniref:Transport inhibitor response 1 domain-containing protein n=1 Tax=Zingiber officinale TaxID=94328 RepID=A0A8J5F456_ZINOF|nr:hypothetical protein ZIOFF_061280 [Zingiber officinale]
MLVLKGRPCFTDFNLVPLGWGTRFSPWLSVMASVSPWLECVCLKWMSVSDADLTLFTRSFPSFCDLTLMCCDEFSNPAIIAELYKNMRVLDLIKNDVEGKDEELVNWISRFLETSTSLELLSFKCVNSK